jgi:integrase
MNTRTASLVIRYKAADGMWKRAKAARGANGRVKAGFARIGSEDVKVEPYTYQVRYYRARKVLFEPAGDNATEAETIRRQFEIQNTAQVIAEQAGLKVVTEEGRKRLQKTAEDYIQRKEDSGHLEAAAQARLVAGEFLAEMGKRKRVYVDEITANDVLAFQAALKRRGCEDRTVANKYARLKSWLKFAGVAPDAINKELTPKYEEKLPTIYSRDKISTLLGAADPYKQLMILLALKCGLRDQEIMHLTYSDIDFERRVLNVRGKKYTDIYPKKVAEKIMKKQKEKAEKTKQKIDTEWAFKVKDKEQRAIPIPNDLLDHPIQAKLLSTIQRWGSTLNECNSFRLTTSTS